MPPQYECAVRGRLTCPNGPAPADVRTIRAPIRPVRPCERACGRCDGGNGSECISCPDAPHVEPEHADDTEWGA